jgi:hypothetical protein
MIRNPKLREELGRAGAEYARKYHGFTSVQYMFGQIYERIWYNKPIDLINMFHPLMPSSYNHRQPMIKHPLVENKIPADIMEKLIK